MHQFPRTPTRPSQTDALFDAKLDRLQSKLVHAAELIADKLVDFHSQPAEPKETPDVRRRAMANALQIWRKCPRRMCAHSQACRGEPAHCLQACLPALPPGALAAYVARSRRRRR